MLQAEYFCIAHCQSFFDPPFSNRLEAEVFGDDVDPVEESEISDIDEDDEVGGGGDCVDAYLCACM